MKWRVFTGSMLVVGLVTAGQTAGVRGVGATQTAAALPVAVAVRVCAAWQWGPVPAAQVVQAGGGAAQWGRAAAGTIAAELTAATGVETGHEGWRRQGTGRQPIGTGGSPLTPHPATHTRTVLTTTAAA